jgi:hypothetical protein
MYNEHPVTQSYLLSHSWIFLNGCGASVVLEGYLTYPGTKVALPTNAQSNYLPSPLVTAQSNQSMNV